MLPEVERTLEDALTTADELGVRVLLVGAWARDLCLPPGARGEPRKTDDADLAILVDDWDCVDRLLEATHTHFTVKRDELILRHNRYQVKVDIIPCGPIEDSGRTLRRRKSTRVLNTAGLAASFDTAEPHSIGSRSVLIPRPSAYVLLKLLSYLDRHALRDLRDLGYVATRCPYDATTIWDDERTRDVMADASLFDNDLPAWFLGLDLKVIFEPEVVGLFRSSLHELAGLEPWHRDRLCYWLPNPQQRIEQADQLIRVLLLATE